MVDGILHETSIHLKEGPLSPSPLLIKFLEKTLYLIESLWRREKAPDSPRRAVLRKVHQALGEWLEIETALGGVS